MSVSDRDSPSITFRSGTQRARALGQSGQPTVTTLEEDCRHLISLAVLAVAKTWVYIYAAPWSSGVSCSSPILITTGS